ncbi:MAG: hypothetical protein ACT4TC_18250, partial [Myxococcaceae bacterium]
RKLEGIRGEAALRAWGASVTGGYEVRANTGYERSRRTLDSLVGRSVGALRTFQQQIVINFSYAFRFGLGLRYMAALIPNRPPNPTTGLPSTLLAMHSAGVSWSPSCDCWTLDFGASAQDVFVQPSFGVNLAIKNFGSFGVAR